MSTIPQEIRQSYSILGYSHLILQETGLYVEEKRFLNRTELLLPYEDLLPVGVAREHNFPFRLTLVGVFVCFGCLKAAYTLITQSGQRESVLWLLLILSGVLIGVIAQALRMWRHDFVITTGRGNLALFDSRRNRAALYAFANSVRDSTIIYLRKQYAEVDPLLPTEPQLMRLEWLRTLGVLNESQFQHLKTRLLGRFYGTENFPGHEHGLTPSVN